MMNFYKTPKLDALNEKFNEFENRFQLKLDEQNTAHKIHIQKLDDKIARLEEENSRTFELIDKLYEYRFKEIHDTIASISTQINHLVSEGDIKIEQTFKSLQNIVEKLSETTNTRNEMEKNDKNSFINQLSCRVKTNSENITTLFENDEIKEKNISYHFKLCANQIVNIEKRIKTIDTNVNICFENFKQNDIDREEAFEYNETNDKSIWDDINTINEKIDDLKKRISLIVQHIDKN